MTDNPCDLEAIKADYKGAGTAQMHLETAVDMRVHIRPLIAEVEALRERVARLRGCDTLDCPECGETTNTDKSGCQVCGAHLSLKNFNGIIREIDANWRHSAVAAEALSRDMRVALEFYADPELIIGHIVDGKIVADMNGNAKASAALKKATP